MTPLPTLVNQQFGTQKPRPVGLCADDERVATGAVPLPSIAALQFVPRLPKPIAAGLILEGEDTIGSQLAHAVVGIAF